MDNGFDSGYRDDNGLPSRSPGSRMAGGIGIGIVAGLGIGLALDTIVLGIIFGGVMGLALGMMMESRQHGWVEAEALPDGRSMALLGLGLLALALLAAAVLMLLIM